MGRGGRRRRCVARIYLCVSPPPQSQPSRRRRRRRHGFGRSQLSHDPAAACPEPTRRPRSLAIGVQPSSLQQLSACGRNRQPQPASAAVARHVGSGRTCGSRETTVSRARAVPGNTSSGPAVGGSAPSARSSGSPPASSIYCTADRNPPVGALGLKKLCFEPVSRDSSESRA